MGFNHILVVEICLHFIICKYLLNIIFFLLYINLFYKKNKNYQKMQNKIEWHISGLKNYWVKYILNGTYYHDNYYVKVLNGWVKHWIIYNSFFSKIRWKANLKWKAHPQFWELWHPIYLKFSVWSMQLLCESAK